MAKKKGTKKGNGDTATEASFEDSFDALRKVLAEMESGKLSLTESMAKYEQGVGLLRVCHEKLGKAKTRIETLLKVDDQGNAVTEPFEHKASVAKASVPQPGTGESGEAGEGESEGEPDADWDGGLF